MAGDDDDDGTAGAEDVFDNGLAESRRVIPFPFDWVSFRCFFLFFNSSSFERIVGDVRDEASQTCLSHFEK